MAKLYQVPTHNSIQYTLDAQYNINDSTLTLNQSVAGIVQAPGVCAIDRVDASGNKTASKREYFTFTGVSTTQLTGMVGGLAGSTNQVHSVGAIVEFTPDIIWGQALYDVITTEHSTGGVHSSLPSLSHIRTGNLIGLSMASLQRAEMNNLVIASLASINQLNISTYLNVSGASVTGQFPVLFPSGASGAIMQSQGGNSGVYALLPNVFVGSSTHDISTTGAQQITGVGFKPKILMVWASFSGATSSAASWGTATATATKCMSQDEGGKMWSTGDFIVIWITQPGTNGVVSSYTFDNDGFTLTWAKNGSPTGTVTFIYTCYG